MIADLHSHSSASDGSLSAQDLICLAQKQGVELMAITDHDTLDGYLSVRDSVDSHHSMRLIAGIELSCVWNKHAIHIVGLNVNPECPVLMSGIEYLKQARSERAYLISDKLASYGFTGAYDYVVDHLAASQIGRPHFAQFLVERGHVSSISAAFKRYLGAGKPCDIKTTWPSLAQVVQWICAEGGVAVLAHPAHYKITATKLRALIVDFKAAGGTAIEVISGNQTLERTNYLASLAEQFDLLASVGSDFHRPEIAWSQLGKVGKLPSHCKPVWSAWQ